jgi:uncharacterized membrane protein YhaH (DUF805 family)
MGGGDDVRRRRHGRRGVVRGAVKRHPLRVAARLGLMGRATRTNVFGFFVFALLGGVALWFYGLTRFRERMPEIRQGDFAAFQQAWAPPWLFWVQIGVGLVFLWLAVRRLHDQDRPGWPALAPTALSLAAAFLPVEALAAFAGLADLVLLVFLFMPPTIGPNRYGPDPRGWRSLDHYRDYHSRPPPS